MVINNENEWMTKNLFSLVSTQKDPQNFDDTIYREKSKTFSTFFLYEINLFLGVARKNVIDIIINGANDSSLYHFFSH